MKMYRYLLITVILASPYSYGLEAWEGCRDEVLVLTNGTKDESILQEADSMLAQYGMGECYANHPTDITVDLIVGIHEGVHFLDLGLNKYKVPPRDSSEIDLSKVEFVLPSLQRFPHPENSLPSVKSVLDRYWQRSDTKQLSEMSYVFTDFYEAYVDDLPMLSSMYLIAGGGTEFNAYTHGLISASHYSDLKNETIASLPVQRGGMLFFAALFNAYYSQMRFELGDGFANLTMPGEISDFQKLLFQFATQGLEISDFCDSLFDTDVQAINDYIELLDPMAFEKVVGQELAVSFTQSVQCPGESIKRAKATNTHGQSALKPKSHNH